MCQKIENLKLQYHVVLINFGLKIENVCSLFADHPTRRCRVFKMLGVVCSKCIREVACGSASSIKAKNRRTVSFVFCTLPDLTGQDRIETGEE